MDRYTQCKVEQNDDNAGYTLRVYIIDDQNKTTYGPVVNINIDELVDESGLTILALND